jgi:hypothetical protein
VKNFCRNLLLLIATMCFCFGCGMKIHKDFSFTQANINIGDGVLYAKLRGTMTNLDENHSATATPYEMLVWLSMIDQEKAKECKVMLDSIVLKNIASGISVPLPINASANFKVGSNGSYSASFIFKDVNVEYTTHELSFKYSFGNECRSMNSGKVKIEFLKSYSETKISFWDTLMGV